MYNAPPKQEGGNGEWRMRKWFSACVALASCLLTTCSNLVVLLGFRLAMSYTSGTLSVNRLLAAFLDLTIQNVHTKFSDPTSLVSKTGNEAGCYEASFPYCVLQIKNRRTFSLHWSVYSTVAAFPSSRPAFRRLQYEKAGCKRQKAGQRTRLSQRYVSDQHLWHTPKMRQQIVSREEATGYLWSVDAESNGHIKLTSVISRSL